MITKHYSQYLPFLAQSYNILLLSNKNYEVYDNIKPLFKSAIQRNTHTTELNNITLTLMNNKIDIVILDTTEDVCGAKKFLDTIQNYNDRIVVINIINKSITEDIINLIISSNCNIIFDTFTSEELNGKLVQIMGLFYTIISIGRREVNLKSGSSNVNLLTNFLDFYEGTSIFIVDDLIELNQKLKAGELSIELLTDIGNKIFEIANIFEKNSIFISVVPIFKSLSDFLIKLEFDTIPPKGLKAFDYLGYIIDDLNKSIMDIFVDRIFQDVYLFEASLQNNIEFMKNNLFLDMDRDSKVDFFDD
jgi:hypothetical protein